MSLYWCPHIPPGVCPPHKPSPAIPASRSGMGTVCPRCPRGHKAPTEPLMNSALMKGVQLKYQTPPTRCHGAGGRTVLGRGHAFHPQPRARRGGPHCPPLPDGCCAPPAWHRGGPDGWRHLAVPFPPPWDSGMGWGTPAAGGTQALVGGIPSAPAAAKNTPLRRCRIRALVRALGGDTARHPPKRLPGTHPKSSHGTRSHRHR